MRIAQRQIHEDALKEHEARYAKDGDTDNANDPMDVGVGGPSEDEESNRDAEASEDGGHEAMFLRSQTILENVGLEIKVDVGTVDDDTKHTCHTDADKDDTCLSQAEAVHDRVD